MDAYLKGGMITEILVENELEATYSPPLFQIGQAGELDNFEIG